MKFKRENRYLVLRWSDIEKYLEYWQELELDRMVSIIRNGREHDGKDPDPKFVCIKDTYPEYEYVWKCIEERVTKKEQQDAN